MEKVAPRARLPQQEVRIIRRTDNPEIRKKILLDEDIKQKDITTPVAVAISPPTIKPVSLAAMEKDLIKEIIRFLTNKDRAVLAQSQKFMRERVKDTPVDLSGIHLGLWALYEIVEANPGMKIIGLNLDIDSPLESSKENFLREIFKHLIKLRIKITVNSRGFNHNIFSSLNNLEYLEYKTASRILGLNSLPKDNKIKSMMITGSSKSLDLSNFSQLTKLVLDDVGLKLLILAGSIEELRISGDVKQIDLPDINKLNVFVFMLSRKMDFSFVKKATQLTELELYSPNYYPAKIDGDYLSSTKLKKMMLKNVRLVSDLTMLSNLESLDYVANIKNKNWSIPKLPTSLVSLKIGIYDGTDLERGPKFNFSIANISNLEKLEKLYLTLDLSPLHLEEIKNCSNLTELSVRSTMTYGTKTIKDYPLLSSLMIIGKIDGTPSRLRANMLLKKVIIDKTNLKDLDCLKDSSVEKLEINETRITNLNFLENCRSLRKLKIYRCKSLVNIDSLFQLNSLQTVEIKSSPVDKKTLHKLSEMLMDRPE